MFTYEICKDSYRKSFSVVARGATAPECGFGFGDEYDQPIYTKTYADGFQGATKVGAFDYFNRTINDGKGTFNRFPLVTLWIEKVDSTAAVAGQLDEVVTDLKALKLMLYKQWQLVFDTDKY